MPDKKINRRVTYLYTQAYDEEEDPIGGNNSWIYFRAPDGMLFELHSVEIASRIANTTTKAITALYDGHEFTNYLIWPGVESKEGLTRFETTYQQPNAYAPLNGWECKEFTVGGRSLATAEAVKSQIIIWYYLKRASREELLEYAIKHPLHEDMFKRALSGITAEDE